MTTPAISQGPVGPVDPAAPHPGTSHVPSESWARTAQRISQIGSWKLDLATNSLVWSSEMYRLYGADRSDRAMTPEDCLASVVAADLQVTRDAYARALRDGEPVNFVHRVAGPGGTIRHVRVRGEAVYGDGGRVSQAIGTAQDVTEDILRHQTVRDDEARLRAVLAAMSEGLVIHAPDGAIVDANPAALEILGLTRDELMGRASIDARWITVREDGSPYPGHEHPAMVALRTGAVLRNQIMGVEDPTRGLRWLRVNAKPIGSDPARPEGVVATFVDVTEARQRDAAQAATAAELDDLYLNAPVGYHTIDSQGCILSINATELGWLGLARHEVVGRAAADFMTPDSRERLRVNLAQLKKAGRTDGVEYDYGPIAGPKRRIRVHASAVYGADGRFVKSRSVLTDITDLHHIRQQLHAILNEQIAMTDNDLIGIVKVRDRRIVWANPGVTRIFGYSPIEIQGGPTRILYADDDSYRLVAQAVARDRAFGAPTRLQLEMKRKDGEIIWVDGSTVLLSKETGESLSVILDITPLKRAQDSRLKVAALEGENRLEREASRIKSTVLSNISHELHTPLNAVIGLANLLHTGVVGPDSTKYLSYVGQIEASGKHLLQLVDTMLLAAKADAGVLNLNSEPVMLSTLVQEVVDLQMATGKRRDVVVHTAVSPDLGPVVVDPLRLREVVGHLVDNATKFSRAGGRVEVRAARMGATHVRLEVEDQGIGIVQADLPRLFTPFTQLSAGTTRAHAGAGLGLALVRQLIELQGGTVDVRSTEGVGSVFTLNFPIGPRVP